MPFKRRNNGFLSCLKKLKNLFFTFSLEIQRANCFSLTVKTDSNGQNLYFGNRSGHVNCIDVHVLYSNSVVTCIKGHV